jgi:Zn-dependent protease/tetratricopeptide (TPR) repeat protein
VGTAKVAAGVVEGVIAIAELLKLGNAGFLLNALKTLAGGRKRVVEANTNGKKSVSPDAQAAYERGGVYVEKRDYDNAIKEFSEAIRLEPEYVKAYIYRGRAYYEKKACDKAICDYTEAIRLKPDCMEAYNYRGEAYSFGKEEYDNAIGDYTEIIKNGPDADWVAFGYGCRGNAFCYKEQYDRAMDDYNEAVRLVPENDVPYYWRAKAWRSLGEDDKAIADLKETLRLNPKTAYAKEMLRELLTKKKVIAAESAGRKWIKRAAALGALFLLVALSVYSLLLPKPPVRPEPPEPDYGWYSVDPEADTFMISTAAELAGLERIVNDRAEGIKPFDFEGRTIILANDIDLYDFCRKNWHTTHRGIVKGWVPIGAGKLDFRGTLEGGGKTIRGLYIDGPAYFPGLFGRVSGTVKNLNLEEVEITTGDFVGSVASVITDSGAILNCHSTGKVAGTDKVGGLAGLIAVNGSVVNSSFSGKVSGEEAVGGVAGLICVNGRVINSAFSGEVSGEEAVGGVAGWIIDSGSVVNSHYLTPMGGIGDIGVIRDDCEHVNAGCALMENLNDEDEAPQKGFINWLKGRIQFLLSPNIFPILGIVFGLIIGFTVHEYCHALFAKRFGDKTSYYQGRVSLNPLRHISRLGILFLLVIGVGWAKPVMITPQNLRRPRRDRALLTAAGPLSNLVLGIMLASYFKALFYCNYHYGLDINFYYYYLFAGEILWYSALINFALFILNLLPIPPLDGGNIVLCALNLKPKDDEWVRIICVPILLLAVLTIIVQSFTDVTIIPIWEVARAMVTFFSTY